jgi:hypothetical protein
MFTSVAQAYQPAHSPEIQLLLGCVFSLVEERVDIPQEVA